jgi:rod shape-determining protein MreC
LVWIGCTTLSVLLLATPAAFRDAVSSGLEWTVFLPVRSVLGWGGRSLLVQQENRYLQRELTANRLEGGRLREIARENEALRRMLGMSARSTLTLTPAVIVGRSEDWRGEVLWTYVTGPMQEGRAVVSTEGLVGRTSRTAGSRVWIETLWNRRVAVSVVDARSGEQGILRWDPGRPNEFSIDPVPPQGDFRVGDRIVTSGLGEIFPRGILVGYVLGAEQNPRTQLKRIRIEPAVHRGSAREVFLVHEKPPGADGSGLFPASGQEPPGPPPAPGGMRLRLR